MEIDNIGIGRGAAKEHGWNNTRLVEATAGCKTETRVNIVYLSSGLQVLGHPKCDEERERERAGSEAGRLGGASLNGATQLI